MHSALYKAPPLATNGNAKLASVGAKDFPPVDASADAVRAWATALCKDASTIVAALDGFDGEALRSIDAKTFGKPPLLTHGKHAVLRNALAAPAATRRPSARLKK